MNATMTQAIAEMRNAVATFQVGQYCLVPGLGVGYASSEADVEQMKAFVNAAISRIEAATRTEVDEQEEAEMLLESFSDVEEEMDEEEDW